MSEKWGRTRQADLETVDGQPSVGSNPTPSASFKFDRISSTRAGLNRFQSGSNGRRFSQDRLQAWSRTTPGSPVRRLDQFARRHPQNRDHGCGVGHGAEVLPIVVPRVLRVSQLTVVSSVSLVNSRIGAEVDAVGWSPASASCRAKAAGVRFPSELCGWLQQRGLSRNVQILRCEHFRPCPLSDSGEIRDLWSVEISMDSDGTPLRVTKSEFVCSLDSC